MWQGGDCLHGTPMRMFPLPAAGYALSLDLTITITITHTRAHGHPMDLVVGKHCNRRATPLPSKMCLRSCGQRERDGLDVQGRKRKIKLREGTRECLITIVVHFSSFVVVCGSSRCDSRQASTAEGERNHDLRVSFSANFSWSRWRLSWASVV